MIRRSAPRTWRRWACLLLAVTPSFVPASEGSLSYGVASWQLQLAGSHKAIVGVRTLREEALYPNAVVPYTEQRFRLGGTFSRDWFTVGFANELSAFLQRPDNQPVLPVPDGFVPAFWNARWTLYEDSKQGVSLFNRVDRLYAQMNFGELELVVGKQVIPIGVGQLFQATSQTPRLPFVMVDPEYQNTEDAVTAKWQTFANIEARYLPAAPGQRGENFHLRMKGNVAGYDAAVIGGRSDDKAFGGVEVAGNIGDQVLRAEVVGYQRDAKAWLQALAGVDYVFNAKWSAHFEAFYNGFGTDPAGYSFAPLLHRSAPYRGKYYLGSSVTFEMGQRWKATLGGLVNVADPSGLFHGFLSYSLGSNLDFIGGQYLGVGPANSEFGGKLALAGPLPARLGIPNLTYALLKYSF